jgi:hypothetical protein
MNEIIADPQFATLGQPASSWVVVTHAGVEMTSSVAGDTVRLELKDTKGANWHAEFRYAPFSVRAGDTLHLSFSIRAETAFIFSVWLGQLEEPWASLVAAENHFGDKEAGPAWQTFQHVWQVASSEKLARLNFALGRIDTVVEIKDISLKIA